MLRIIPSPAVLGAALSLALVGGAPVAAQSNSLFLLQESPVGSQIGNVLEIDQRGAQQARIAGFNPARLDELRLDYGDDGPLYLLGTEDPAIQRGEGNRAEINITGLGGTALLVQQGADSGFGEDNVAVIEVSGLRALGVIEQSGNNNRGEVVVTGDLSAGTLIQRGDNNTQTLLVESAGTSVVVLQAGGTTVADPVVSVFSNSGGTIQINQTRF